MRSTRRMQSGAKRGAFRTIRRAAASGVELLERRTLMASIVVNTTADNAFAGDGLTTLREALTAANATPAVADTITFNLGAGAHTINLAGALPDLSSQMTIQGPGADLLTVRRNTGGDYGVFSVSPSTVTLAGLTISNGVGAGGILNTGTLAINDCVIRDNVGQGTFEFAGGIWNLGGVLTLNNCTITGNTSSYSAGGIANSGTATVNNCTISNNTSSYRGGGGILSSGTLTVRNSTISGNSTGTAGFSTSGGGILAGGSAVIENSTFSNNNAASGSAISCYGSIIRNCTFDGNRSINYFGGGTISCSDTSITHCTISGNTADGSDAVDHSAGVQCGTGTTISSTIIAGNTVPNPTADPNIHGPFTDAGHNFIGGDPRLAPLADNGGPTKTMALLPDSTCINRGDPNFTGPPDFDQRGGAPFARKVGPRIDIGAFESDVLNAKPTTAGINDMTVPEDAADSHLNLRVYFDDAEDGPDGLVYTIVGNTNASLIASAPIDDATDELTLDWADDANGTSEVTVRGTDSGGRYVESTFSVAVLSAAQQVQLLKQHVEALPGLNHGNLNSLLVKLNLKGDADKVAAFIDHVESMVTSGKIAGSHGDALIAAAEDLLGSLA